MDALIVWEEKTGEFVCTEMRKVRAGQPVVIGKQEDGSTGVLAYHTGFARAARSGAKRSASWPAAHRVSGP